MRKAVWRQDLHDAPAVERLTREAFAAVGTITETRDAGADRPEPPPPAAALAKKAA